MKYEINNEVYDVVIEKKNNKNLYIRVKEDLTILVTTNYLTTKKQILDVLDQNQSYIMKMIEKRKTPTSVLVALGVGALALCYPLIRKVFKH